MEQIQFIGLHDLEAAEQLTAKRLSAEYHEKIKRALKNETSLTLHIKLHGKEGSKKKYSLHAKAIAPTVMFEASDADYDFARALHKVYESLQREIGRKFNQ